MASSAKGVRAGGAYVEMFIKDNFSKPLNKIAMKFKAMGAVIRSIGLDLTGIGSAVTGPLAGAAAVFASMGDEINKSSQRTGVAVEELSALKYAADQSGASLEDLEAGFRKMSNTITDARNGSAQATQTLAKLGLSMAQLQSLKPDEQFKLIADALSRVSNATTKASLAQDIFGKGGTALLPLLADGAAGIAALEKRARDLGVTFGKDDANAATAFGDILDDLGKQLKAVTFNAGAAVAKALQPYAEATTRILKPVIDWVRENGRLVVTIGAVAAGVTAAGVGLVGLSLGISAVGVVLAGVATGVAAVGTVLGALVSPIGLVVAGLAGLGVWFVRSTTAGGEAMKWLGDRFDDVAAVAKDAFGSIADALSAGDIALAGKILFGELNVIFTAGLNNLKDLWGSTWTALVRAALSVADSIQKAFAGMFTAIINQLDTLQQRALSLGGSALQTAGRVVQKTTGLSTVAGALNVAGVGVGAAGGENSAILQAANMGVSLGSQQLSESIGAIKDILSAGNDEAARQRADELSRMIAELQNLQQQARDQRKSPSLNVTPQAAVADALEGLNQKLAARGTFNAAAIQSLQSSPVQERIAKAAERTARGVDRLLNAGGLA